MSNYLYCQRQKERKTIKGKLQKKIFCLKGEKQKEPYIYYKVSSCELFSLYENISLNYMNKMYGEKVRVHLLSLYENGRISVDDREKFSTVCSMEFFRVQSVRESSRSA